MKAVLSIATGAVLASMLLGCSGSTMFPAASTAIEKSALVGTWNCLTLTSSRLAGGGFADDKAFSADEWYTSTRFPEGKKYAYRIDGGKLIVSFRAGDQSEQLVRLTADALDLYRGWPGQLISVSCRKKS